MDEERNQEPKTLKTLKLSRETLRELDRRELEQVVGGGTQNSNGRSCRDSCRRWC